MMKPIRVVLVDDHQLFRQGLRALLEDLQDIEVVGEAGDGEDALSLVATLEPDVVLMDIEMPKVNGFSAIKKLSQEQNKARCIVLSMYASRQYVDRALTAGARGYLLKEANVGELELAIRSVLEGALYLTQAVTHSVTRRESKREIALRALTDRQREVLRLLSEGLNTREIGRELHISEKTVESHRAALMKRLGIYDIARLVRFAMGVGLVRDEEPFVSTHQREREPEPVSSR